MSYINFGSMQIDPKNSDAVIQAYEQGYVATRSAEVFERVISLRVDLEKFALSSENRRILRKFPHLCTITSLPFEQYTWEIHKMGKDFYDTKFGVNTFTANKIKELFTSSETNFNSIITFKNNGEPTEGYCVALSAESNGQKILHYAYPFYSLQLINTSFGMYMMTRTLSSLKETSYKYVYLGSVHTKSSLYKLQFTGIEWFDTASETWKDTIEELKEKVVTLESAG